MQVTKYAFQSLFFFSLDYYTCTTSSYSQGGPTVRTKNTSEYQSRCVNIQLYSGQGNFMHVLYKLAANKQHPLWSFCLFPSPLPVQWTLILTVSRSCVFDGSSNNLCLVNEHQMTLGSAVIEILGHSNTSIML